MSKFKVGDKAVNIRNGKTYVIIADKGPAYEFRYQFLTEGGGYSGYFSNNELDVPLKRGWDNLQVGDVIYKPGCKNDYVMIDVFPNTFHAQGADTTGTSVFVGSKQSYINSGWKIRGAEPKRTELTLDEIADKFGIPVKTLKIKK